MKNLSTWQLIYSSLAENIPVVLLYVLESQGSSPGRQGFFMAVNSRGDMEGSVGGGIMEHKFVELAKEKLKDSSKEAEESAIRRQVHDKMAKNQSGMICSGEQTILIYTLNKNELDIIGSIINSLENNRNGELILSPGSLRFNNKVPDEDYYYEYHTEADWLYKEKTGYKNQLSIIGGGHCSLALSKLMRGMDFYVRVFDDRAGLKTMQENKDAHEKHLVENYTELGKLVESGNHHYVVIMTFGYRTDDIALRALLDKKFNYLGLLGSRNKIDKMFEEYREEGITEQQLQGIHAPVGISIYSQSPEEIAVSIAAEIIRVKNEKR